MIEPITSVQLKALMGTEYGEYIDEATDFTSWAALCGIILRLFELNKQLEDKVFNLERDIQSIENRLPFNYEGEI